MPRASRTITLVLMGSAALLLSGATCDQNQQTTTQPASGTGGAHYMPVHNFAPAGRQSPSTPHASPRGGFGATGHAVGA